ncbi:MAG: hypothetical protein ACLQMT_04435 [Candidatus Acidiferrales bacterium]
MGLAEAAGIAIVCVVVLATVGLVTSRSAIDRLVGAGILPRAFSNLVPVLTIAARALAIGLTIVGIGLVGVNGGWLSREWLERYGWATLLVVVGLFCTAITFRRKR